MPNMGNTTGNDKGGTRPRRNNGSDKRWKLGNEVTLKIFLEKHVKKCLHIKKSHIYSIKIVES